MFLMKFIYIWPCLFWYIASIWRRKNYSVWSMLTLKEIFLLCLDAIFFVDKFVYLNLWNQGYNFLTRFNEYFLFSQKVTFFVTKCKGYEKMQNFIIKIWNFSTFLLQVEKAHKFFFLSFHDCPLCNKSVYELFAIYRW